MRSAATDPAPGVPLPLSTSTAFCFLAACAASATAGASPLPVVASTVFEPSSTISSSVGGNPWSTRAIIFFHSSTSLISYQMLLMYWDVVGSMAE